jgi:hypothetical protein
MIKLRRVSSTDKGTFGVLLNNDIPLCLTCEDPWNKNKRNVSCIPAGTYTFKKRFSVKYKNHWILDNVPGRDLILIHAGNTINDTSGCILVGRSFSQLGKLPSVMQSQEAMQLLRETLPDEGVIEIID